MIFKMLADPHFILSLRLTLQSIGKSVASAGQPSSWRKYLSSRIIGCMCSLRWHTWGPFSSGSIPGYVLLNPTMVHY